MPNESMPRNVLDGHISTFVSLFELRPKAMNVVYYNCVTCSYMYRLTEAIILANNLWKIVCKNFYEYNSIYSDFAESSMHLTFHIPRLYNAINYRRCRRCIALYFTARIQYIQAGTE